MLLVLVALVLGLTAATIAAQVAVTATLTRKLDRAQEVADDAANGTLARIERWLATESDRAVAPVTATAPAIGVIDETVPVEAGTSMTVRITAYDQCGMVPWAEVGSLGRLATALPSDVREAIAGAGQGETVPGLDLIAIPSAGEGEGPSRPVWPQHAAITSPNAIRHYGEAAEASPMLDASEETEGPESIGSLVATHCSGRPAINVNTAPRELIGFVENLTQRSVWQVVEERRAAGKPASIAGITSSAGGAQDDEGMPTFVSTSDTWSFRVDVTYGSVRSSWWLTYTRSDRGWLLRQRLRVLA
jgi:hypothetical protein